MARLNCVTVLAPAKLNLALDVVGLLPSGYHDLDMTMQAITLYERVVLRRSPYLNLRLPGSLVAPNNKNTAIKAALAFFDYTGLLAGVDITIYKNTPVRAGMAGGSADAAAVLVGMNELYGARLSMSELCALGAKIGADVPFALMGGTCRVKGVGAGVLVHGGDAGLRRFHPGGLCGLRSGGQQCPPGLRRTGSRHPCRRSGRPLRCRRQCAGRVQRSKGHRGHQDPAAGAWCCHRPDDRQRCGGVRRVPGRRGRTDCCTGRKAALEAGVRGAA